MQNNSRDYTLMHVLYRLVLFFIALYSPPELISMHTDNILSSQLKLIEEPVSCRVLSI